MKELYQGRCVKYVMKGKRKISRKACKGCEGNYAHLIKRITSNKPKCLLF